MQRVLYLIFLSCSLSFSLNGQEIFSVDSLKVSAINVDGNTITSKKVVFRELVFKLNHNVAGKDVEYIKETSINNLNKLALFNFIEIETSEESEGTLLVNVKLTERWFLWPQAYLNHTERNFSEWWRKKDLRKLEYGVGFRINNFRGMGESLELKYHIGSITRYEFEYSGIHLDKAEHHFLSLHTTFLALSNVPWAVESNKQVILKSSGRLLNSTDLEIKYKYRKEYFNSHSLALKFADYEAADTILSLNPYFFGPDQHTQRYFEISYEFTRDTRDSHFYPKTGYLLVAGINKKGLGIMHDEYSSVDLSFQLFAYRKLASRLYGASGILCSSTSNDNHVFYSQSGLGYFQFVRGYEYYVANGDKSMLFKSLLNFELLPKKVVNLKIWPIRKAYQFNKIPIEIYSNVFFDAGYVRDKSEVFKLYNNTLVNKFLYSAGIGIDFITYYDKILRFDYSFNAIGEHGLFIHWKAAIR